MLNTSPLSLLQSLGHVCPSPCQQVQDYRLYNGSPALPLFSFFDVDGNTNFLVFTGEAVSLEDFAIKYVTQILNK